MWAGLTGCANGLLSPATRSAVIPCAETTGEGRRSLATSARRMKPRHQMTPFPRLTSVGTRVSAGDSLASIAGHRESGFWSDGKPRVLGSSGMHWGSEKSAKAVATSVGCFRMLSRRATGATRRYSPAWFRGWLCLLRSSRVGAQCCKSIRWTRWRRRYSCDWGQRNLTRVNRRMNSWRHSSHGAVDSTFGSEGPSVRVGATLGGLTSLVLFGREECYKRQRWESLALTGPHTPFRDRGSSLATRCGRAWGQGVFGWNGMLIQGIETAEPGGNGGDLGLI